MNIFADVIFENGPVITVNKNNDIAEAVAIKDNRIIGVGTKEYVYQAKGSDTRMIDLQGRTLMPGFIDSHMHFSIYGMKLGPLIDIDYEKVSSIAGIKDIIQEAAKNREKGEWICLWGYDHNKIKELRHPTIEDLDEAAPDNPVRCVRCCGHMAVYNSYALRLIGIKDEKGYPPGEVVTKDGKLTGLIKDGTNMWISSKIMMSEKQITEGLIAADRSLSSLGVTTAHDAGAEGDNTIKLMAEACREGLIKTRLRVALYDLSGKEASKVLNDHYIATGMTSGFGNEHFSIGPIKMFMDGSSSGPSSLMREPYCHDPKLGGIQSLTQDETDEWVANAHNAGYQVTAHALGDKAVDMIIDAMDKALKANPKENCRFRIEHCGFADAKQRKRIRDLGIVPVPNPGFIELNGKDYISYYGDRVGHMFPCKSYIDEGIIACMGSDAPVIPPNPMIGVWAAITRKDGKWGDVVGENQRIGLMDALRMYTYNGAYASFEEDIKGSIEEGKLADIVVLSEDIQRAPVDRIKDIKVDLTMIDGKIVYAR